MTPDRSRWSSAAIASLTLLVTATDCAHHEVKPDSMSAEQHRQEAAKESKQAEKEIALAKQAPPAPNLSVGNGNPTGFYESVGSYDLKGEYLARARELEGHAQQHRDAARQLEAFAENECANFAPQTRAACPMLGPVRQIAEIPGGVRVRFSENTPVDTVAAHMRCHLAYAKVVGFDPKATCPLYVRGLEIQVSDAGKAIDLTSRDPKTVATIRARTREEAILVGQQ